MSATKEFIQTARDVEEALFLLEREGIIHEDVATAHWLDYLTEVVGMTRDEWNEVA